MARLRSRIPRALAEVVDQERYLEGLDRRIPARADLADGATTADVVAAWNAFLQDLRDNGLMES